MEARWNDYIGTYGVVHRSVDDEVSSYSLETACGRSLVDGVGMNEVPKHSTLCKRCFGLPIRRSRRQQRADFTRARRLAP